MNAQGQVQVKHRSLNIKIPKGIKAGQHIRLAGQGSPDQVAVNRVTCSLK